LEKTKNWLVGKQQPSYHALDLSWEISVFFAEDPKDCLTAESCGPSQRAFARKPLKPAAVCEWIPRGQPDCSTSPAH